jgi:hypothetical protein
MYACYIFSNASTDNYARKHDLELLEKLKAQVRHAARRRLGSRV